MKITAIKAAWLQVPIPADKASVSDFGRNTSFNTTLVRVETDEGLIGYGEAKASVGSLGVQHALVTTIEKELAPLLIGQDPRDIARLWELMYSGSRAHYALSRGRVFPILSRRGITISAISGIDMALWDILGLALGVPVHRLLGGKCRDRLPAYASGGWADERRIGEELLGYIQRGGFKAVKMRVGVMDGDVATSVRRVQAARQALGDGIDIMVDAHGTYSVTEAKRFCREAAEVRLAWFEEPVSADNKRGCAEVRAATDIPIAAGESEFTRFDFRDLVDLRAVDIFQPDLAICGGITEGLRIAALADAYQIGLAPHLWGGALMFSAGLQLCAVSPSAFIIEYSLLPNPLQSELATEPITVEDGQIIIPDRPGLGVTINDDFVKKYTV
ncbi:MAG: mandelate racemase/muconate lactonizing enzyme family protein [Thermodesulfobacteriota bacterium]|nr:mandelate racemase/muconate lactonizing enzyme family protein [Thermodesulfobacteriota bacterium]